MFLTLDTCIAALTTAAFLAAAAIHLDREKTTRIIVMALFGKRAREY